LLLLLVPASSAEIRERPAQWAQPMLSAHLENFYRIDARVYRAAQPDSQAMRELAAYGIGELLNLREYHDDQDLAAGSGLVLHRVAMSAGQIQEAEVITALRIIKNARRPILIHCWHGADRTGLISALYRMVLQNWSVEQALDELQHGGYGFHALYQNIPAYLRSVEIEEIRRAVLRE
jgi:protein tyrosine phosphatase (PTP) superfamily phosphohydrolase (DUF442 family)